MRYLPINPRKFSSADLDVVSGFLHQGSVMILPTDTIYGLSCRADNAPAIKKIYRLKKRDRKKPLIILVSSLAMLKKYAYVSAAQELYLKKAWSRSSRPTTVVLRHRGRLPRELAAETASLAVRLPKSDLLIKIIRKVKVPIVSTSLNLSGQEAVRDLRKISQYFPKENDRPDFAVDAGTCRRTKPSRLIDLRNGNKPLILR